MRLQKVANQKRGDKTYHKWQVTLPPNVVKEMGWQGGEELEAEATKAGLIITKKDV